ncbi:hypothetical protein ACKLNR_006881 [Fusarium oxysporum f. sp. zingiberi]
MSMRGALLAWPLLSAPGRPHLGRAGIDTHIVIPREKDVRDCIVNRGETDMQATLPSARMPCYSESSFADS